MNMALEFSTVSKSNVMQSLGEQDAKYIYKVRNFVRYTEIASRQTTG